MKIEQLAKLVTKEGYAPVLLHPEMRRLCELVHADAIAEEREACAKWYGTTGHTLMRHEVPDAIRARGNT